MGCLPQRPMVCSAGPSPLDNADYTPNSHLGSLLPPPKTSSKAKLMPAPTPLADFLLKSLSKFAETWTGPLESGGYRGVEVAEMMTKKNICFAGFGAEELETLKHAASGISGAWECTFFEDAAAALEAMKSRPFDAVVANMQIKGMNGAQLLQRVGELHPTALRFVIGDLEDQELIISCIGDTHQFVSRPYKPQELISIVQRSFALDACLSSDQLRAITPKLGRLPTLPSTYFEVLKRVESRDASAESVGEVIARDPAATARILQMVNSAAFALAQKVSDPAHA